MLIAVGAVALAGCRAGLDDFADRDRSWAPLPEEMAMPAAAPDDPAAYRGVRSRIVEWVSARRDGSLFCREGRPVGSCPPSVESGGKAVPWLSSVPVEHPNGSSPFGFQVVNDGRRWMVWFFRSVEPSNSMLVSPSELGERVPLLRHPLVAVLDVHVLREGWRSAEGRWGWERGCGPDGYNVIIEGDDGWRLNRSTGRIGRIDPDDADCPDD
jgi:hypothetical protein